MEIESKRIAQLAIIANIIISLYGLFTPCKGACDMAAFGYMMEWGVLIIGTGIMLLPAALLSSDDSKERKMGAIASILLGIPGTLILIAGSGVGLPGVLLFLSGVYYFYAKK